MSEDEDRIDELASPLLDMLLEFERHFDAKAMELGLSNEDAETLAAVLEGVDAKHGERGLGSVYAYFLRHVRMARIFRDFSYKATAVMASGGNECMTIQEVHEEYDKLGKGDA